MAAQEPCLFLLPQPITSLYLVAGKVVRHAGAVILKIQEAVWALWEEIRTRCGEVARA